MEPLKTKPHYDSRHSRPTPAKPQDAPASDDNLSEPFVRRAQTMRAIAYREYGSPEVLQLERASRPVAGKGSVLVKVAAAAANPYDWHFMRGEPYFMRLFTGLRGPKASCLGVDFAGQVEAVGQGVTHLRPGDDVFGVAAGAFAEYVSAPAGQVARKPGSLSYEEAAAIPLAALTALQGLRDVAGIEAGQRILIIGASGGVGTFAVQIAKTFGAEVTGVCSTRNLDLVRSLGADQVIDYTREDFWRADSRYDVIFQLAGMRSPSDCVGLLAPTGTLIQSSGEAKGRWLGPLRRLIQAAVLSRFVGQTLTSVDTKRSREDLEYLAELVDAGQIEPVIDRTYSLSETPEAIRYLERGRARGKVVVAVRGSR